MSSSSPIPPPPPSASGMTPSLQKLATGETEVDGLPRKFGKYTLLRKLATGGMAELFLALQKSVAGFEKLVVIKRVLPHMMEDRAFVDMLLQEARIAATLSHPNIVQIFDVGEAEAMFYIAMEHVHGEDIRSVVRQMKSKDYPEFPVEHALAIVLGVCSGLSYAHERRDLDGTPMNIVHRDISPQNVVITFSGDVKIVDFGIAKSDAKMQTETKSGRLKGKVPYMSPEQARGEKIDARSDIFSTGVMLFELTTGRRLFRGQSEFETLKLICDREYPRPSEIRPGYPPALEKIVVKALAKDRAERFQSARDMQTALEDFIREERVAVSTVALQHFMQTLFTEKLASQKEAIQQGKQLADIIDRENPEPPASAEVARPSQSPRQSTLSMPAAARTVTGVRKYQNKSYLVGLAALALLLGGGIGTATFVRNRAALPASRTTIPSATSGAISLESDPAGASIWIQGEARGEVTPTSIGGLPFDRPIEVRIGKKGFDEEVQSVTLTSDRATLALRAALRPTAAPVESLVKAETPKPVESSRHHHQGPTRTQEDPKKNGRLNVDRTGGWCNVQVDGVSQGATPIAGVELSAGPHRVTCSTADGKVDTAVVNVPADGVARYKFGP